MQTNFCNAKGSWCNSRLPAQVQSRFGDFLSITFFSRSKARWRVANSFPNRPTQVCILCEIKKEAKSNKLKRLILFIQGNPCFQKSLRNIRKKTWESKVFYVSLRNDLLTRLDIAAIRWLCLVPRAQLTLYNRERPQLFFSSPRYIGANTV